MYSEIIVLIVSYLIGNISGGLILGKLFRKQDIRDFGSKNAGTTNAVRVFGLKIGIATFLIDFFKAFIACFFGFSMLGTTGTLISAIGVVLGHNWPIFLNFKGGKGIASSFGFIFFFDFRIAICCGLFFAIVAYISKYVSLASILSSIFSVFVVYLFGYRDTKVFLTFLALCLLSIYRHRENIARLLNGTENKISKKSKNK